MTQSIPILELAVPVRMWRRFDYLPPEGVADVQCWLPGIRVLVPFGKRSLVGILLAVKSETEVPLSKLKSATSRLDEQPLLTETLLKLCQWVSDYYHHPLGEVFSFALPKMLREQRQPPELKKIDLNSAAIINESDHVSLNSFQQQAVEKITAARGFQTFLLDGITGSGKTEVYFQSITALLREGKQALILVPEIALTPQMVSRFENRFNVSIVLLHSNLTEKKRAHHWFQARQGQAAIIIGTRSAIFTPLLNPGIIILDEEHDLSFKQQSGLRYSARDIAIVRAQLENVPIILGSATPSLESYYNSQSGRYHYLNLPIRAGISVPPKVSVINLRDKRLSGGLSQPLLSTMHEHLSRQGQVLLFLNRRGYAALLMCHHCGWMAQCSRCDARLTLHFQPNRLHCHHCDLVKKLPTHCEDCRQSELIHVGQGTERIEQVIGEQFPEYQIVRIDRDTTRKRGSMEELLAKIHSNEAQILIGTQMLAKGHHFPNLTLAAIVEADGGLFSVDFRALERMAQLLVQVGGRAGRSEQAGEVIIQTHHPDHPHLQLLLRSGYQRFAQAILTERQQTLLPPFAHLAMLRAEALQKENTHEFLNSAKTIFLEKSLTHPISVLGPIPAPMERCAGRFRGQLLLQSAKRAHLQQALKSWVPEIMRCKMANKVRWSLDIDPQEMI